MSSSWVLKALVVPSPYPGYWNPRKQKPQFLHNLTMEWITVTISKQVVQRTHKTWVQIYAKNTFLEMGIESESKRERTNHTTKKMKGREGKRWPEKKNKKGINNLKLYV